MLRDSIKSADRVISNFHPDSGMREASSRHLRSQQRAASRFLYGYFRMNKN